MSSRSNFNGTIVSLGGEDVHPQSLNELEVCVTRAREMGVPVRVVGHGLSFNGLGQQDDAMRIHLTTHLNRIRRVYEEDAMQQIVVVQAGITLFALCEQLARHHGLALRNIPHYGGMTLGGALAIGIHGTSGREACDTLSSSIVSLDLVDGRSKRVTLSASDSITLGMLGVVYQVTLRTIPLFDVYHCAVRIPHSPHLSRVYDMVVADLITHDWVMYKYLCGAFSQTCIRETFDRVTSHAPLQLVESIVNDAQTTFDDTKTWCKYFFPASATDIPWRNDLYVWICERQHRAPYFRAMMGPQVISPHAEIEWCVPLSQLDHVLIELDEVICALASEENDSSTFYRQPIECHVRFSPPDKSPGHGAFEGETRTNEWFAWINLNVRQHLDQASQAFVPIEAVFMRHGARVHWSKCWSASPALFTHVRQQQALFLARIKHLGTIHDPSCLFRSHAMARQLGLQPGQ
jgi:hypothetical protein